MLSPCSMRRSSSLNVARVLAIASGWASARLSATAATLTGPPESANNRRTARSTGVSLASRRAPARASTSLSPSSSAVLITRFVKIGLLLTCDERRVCTNSRVKGFPRGGYGHGSSGTDRHRWAVEAHGHEHRDDPLLRAGRVAARSGSEFGRLPPVRHRPAQA